MDRAAGPGCGVIAQARCGPLLVLDGGLPAKLPPRVLGTLPVDADTAEALIAMSLLTVAAVARGRWQIAAGMLSLLLFLPPDRARRVEMHVLDLGQGDGLLLLDGDRTLLIDGGGWREGDFGGRVLRPVLVSLGVRRLDVAVVTHFDTDHCGGLELPSPASSARDGGQQQRPVAGHGGGGLWTARSAHERREPGGGEKGLVEGGVAVDVLKVAHHGSRTSTSEMFLQATRPRSASISVGVRNGYSHPAPEVVDRLRAHRIHVLRTDRDGMITWRFDERGARVRVSGRGLATRAAGGLVPVVLPRLQ